MVYTVQLLNMTISSVCTDLSTIKAPLFSHQSSLEPSTLAAILSDHDYALRVETGDMDSNMIADSGVLVRDYDEGPTVLETVVGKDVAVGPGDTDFLKDLGDMNFSVDDFDLSSNLEMEDSIEDFIDSALEKAYLSASDQESSKEESLLYGHDTTVFSKEDSFQHAHDTAVFSKEDSFLHDHDTAVFSKDDFLAVLHLRPTIAALHLRPNTCVDQPKLPSAFCKPYFDSKTDINEISPCVSPHYSNSTSFLDRIPTKKCSRVGSIDVTKSVYSTAQSSSQDNVRVCPSTSAADRSDKCLSCSQDTLPRDRPLLPLYVQTFADVSEAVKNQQDRLRDNSEMLEFHSDAADVTLLKDTGLEIHSDAADVTLLKDTQYTNPHWQHYDYSVRNNSEQITHNDFSVSSMDFETFVDLDDFLDKTTSSQELFKRDNSHQRISDDTKYNDTYTQSESFENKNSETVSNSVDFNETKFPYSSQLKFTFLGEQREQFREDYAVRFDNSDTFSESSPQDSKTSGISYCISPTWSVADTTAFSVSPSSLANIDFWQTSFSEDTVEGISLKSQLALLKLFSDENATSLFHSDIVAPVLRFT